MPITDLEYAIMYESLFSFPTGLFAEFDRLQRAPGSATGTRPGSIRATSRAYPPINISSTPAALEIDVFVPGADPAKLDVQIDRGLLTISGERPADRPAANGDASVYATERYTGEFKRAISLSDDVNPAAVSAEYRDGILRISLGRRETAQPRRVEIN